MYWLARLAGVVLSTPVRSAPRRQRPGRIRRACLASAASPGWS